MFVREELLKARLQEKGSLFILKLYDYAGAIHLHSDYSHDGRTTTAKIVQAARENSLDYLMFTDHSWLQARNDGLERWYDDVLVFVGVEVTPRFNHYIAFGIDEPLIVCDIPWIFPYEDDLEVEPQFYIDWVRGRGGLGFIAHPDHEGAVMFHVKQHPWLDWGVEGYTGIGVWDFMTDWQSTLTGYLRALIGYLFPAHVLKGPKSITLTRWDELNRHGKVVGIGELDNHDTLKKLLWMQFEIFPFHRAFKFVTTHVLTETPFIKEEEFDRDLLLRALRRGRAYIALEYFHKAKGFSFIIMDDSEVATMGDDFFLDELAVLRVDLPREAKIRVIKDGELFRESVGKTLEFGIDETGLYRVEVYLKAHLRYRPWIFSNPIYVK